MCLNELLELAEYQRLPRADQEVAFLGMLLHDIAKCSTTVVDSETGRIGHPCHSRKGAIDARVALWDAGVPFEQREAICRIVAAHYAVDKAKELLRQTEPFVWNATHLSQQMRDKTLNLLFAYGAEVELVYLEKPRGELLRRNGRRDSTLTNKALEAMTLKWELPLPTEAHCVSYLPE